ncbi:MAG: FAD-dependent oxidoreductase [Gemmatimonadales bacterium]|jgi:3-phenylpropionate/trans-cinnamate dioxygenase ferredoxin reductase subunit
MSKSKYLILGGGVAAGYAAREFVKLGLKPGELSIVSAEDQPPYDRPPLSKDVLKGEAAAGDAVIEGRQFYEEHGIELRLGTEIDRVDFGKRRLGSGDEEFEFEKLLIATGARAKRFDLPGADRDGIFYLHTSRHLEHIVEAAEGADRVVVIGGSFIGTEVSASLTERGLHATLVFPEKRIMENKPLTWEMSAFFEHYFRKRGVEVLAGQKVKAFRGDGAVAAVVLDRDRELETRFVVAGIGVIPNTELFGGTPLKIDDGIIVDEYLQTGVPDVYAVGDVARYTDKLLGGSRRIEHWANAKRQAEHVARSMMGDRQPYEELPYFFSDVFDLSWEYWGDRTQADRVVYRGDVDSGSFSAWWLRGRRVVAAFVMDRPGDEREAAQTLITSRREIDPSRLTDESRSVIDADGE